MRGIQAETPGNSPRGKLASASRESRNGGADAKSPNATVTNFQRRSGCSAETSQKARTRGRGGELGRHRRAFDNHRYRKSANRREPGNRTRWRTAGYPSMTAMMNIPLLGIERVAPRFLGDALYQSSAGKPDTYDCKPAQYEANWMPVAEMPVEQHSMKPKLRPFQRNETVQQDKANHRQ